MFQKNVPLKEYVHYKIGGKADYFCEPKNIDELRDAILEARNLSIPVFVLGSGTNLLVSDKGFRGLVIRPKLEGIRREGNKIIAGSGVLMSELLEFAANAGLSGLEWAGGLPGTVGGAVRGNAGAFSGEMKDSVHEVAAINTNDPDLKLVRRENPEAQFGYRTSIFKEIGTEVIIEAILSLTPGDPETIRKAGESRMAYRKERHPMEYPSLGSTFKNVPVSAFKPEVLPVLQGVIKNDPFPVVPTAYLISESGVKGIKSGGAQVSEKHPNFIVNLGGATAKDVEALIALVKEKVKEKFGIVLEEEVMRLGE